MLNYQRVYFLGETSDFEHWLHFFGCHTQQNIVHGQFLDRRVIPIPAAMGLQLPFSCHPMSSKIAKDFSSFFPNTWQIYVAQITILKCKWRWIFHDIYFLSNTSFFHTSLMGRSWLSEWVKPHGFSTIAVSGLRCNLEHSRRYRSEWPQNKPFWSVTSSILLGYS